MARIDIRANVLAPSEINIPLVRADHHETSNVFRAFFEIFLSLFSGLLGYVLSLERVEPIHYVALAITGVGAASFMVVSMYFSSRSKDGISRG